MKKSTKIILSIASIAFLSGCNIQQKISEPTKPVVNIKLEEINASTIKAIPDIASIALEWARPKDKQITGYHIYRGEAKEGAKLQRIDTLDTRFASHYLDTKNIKPDTTYVYSISSKGADESESKSSANVAIKTLPILTPVSLFNAISNLPRQVKLIWRPHPDNRIAEYKIEKRAAETTEWKTLATVKGRLQVEYIDDKLEDDRIFFYKITAVSFDKIPTEVSMEAKAQTKALPVGTSNLSATNSLPKKIKLNWQGTTTKDAENYYVYRNNADWGTYSLLKAVPISETSYEDIVEEDGVTRFYKVTTVDSDNLESKMPKNPVMGATLAKPEKPIITLAQIADEKVILNWKAGDNRTKKFNIYKFIKQSWLKSEKIDFAKVDVDKSAMFQRVEDKDIIRGVEYKYTIEAIDEFGLVSEESPAVVLTLPALPKKEESQQQTKQPEETAK